MKAKLIKTGESFLLKDVNNETLAITSGTMQGRMLSLKNCQVIERGYDLDELAKTIFPDKIFTTDEEHEIPVDGPPYQWGFKVGFQKALELMGDKKFSEEDVKNIFAKTLENAPSMESHTRMISDEQYRHSVMDELYDKITNSLQQTEWDVIVEMEDVMTFASMPKEGENRVYEQPKLDENGCLILKKI